MIFFRWRGGILQTFGDKIECWGKLPDYLHEVCFSGGGGGGVILRYE